MYVLFSKLYWSITGAVWLKINEIQKYNKGNKCNVIPSLNAHYNLSQWEQLLEASTSVPSFKYCTFPFKVDCNDYFTMTVWGNWLKHQIPTVIIRYRPISDDFSKLFWKSHLPPLPLHIKHWFSNSKHTHILIRPQGNTRRNSLKTGTVFYKKIRNRAELLYIAELSSCHKQILNWFVIRKQWQSITVTS